tara:strand:- start:16436 stop:17608 length:1173 start_codon:yes stop_codon:yes gene_type:complete
MLNLTLTENLSQRGVQPEKTYRKITMIDKTARAANAPIDKVLEKIRRSDYVAPRNQLRFHHNRNEDGRSLGYSISLSDKGTEVHRFNTNQHFNHQTASYLGSGLKEYSRHLHETNQRELLVHNFNKQLERQEGRALIRTIGEDRKARAFLSSKYKVVDDAEVFAPVVEMIAKDSNKYRTLGGQRTDTRTYLKFISREPIFQLGERTCYAGFQGGNSEVGKGSASIKAFIFDSFCENGCTFGNLEMFNVKFRHVGADISTPFGEVFDELQLQQSQQIVHALKQAVAKVLDPSTHSEIADLLVRGANRRITGDMGAVLKGVGAKFKLTKAEQEDILLTADEKEPHAYGVQAAITKLAQEASSYDRRAELEEIGGKVLTMSDNQWNSIAALTK